MRGKFISYLRVSTEKQGERGFGIDAQRNAVTDFLSTGNYELLGEYVEIESGKRNDRPQLTKALAACRKLKAKLVIAKLDRLARSVSFVANLMDGKIDFVCCDMPQATRFTIHVLAAAAEQEREATAKRTSEALQAARRRGRRLGTYGADVLAPANRAAAIARAEAMAPILIDMRRRGLSAKAMAMELNERKIATANSAKWHAQTVIRTLRRIQPNHPAERG